MCKNILRHMVMWIAVSRVYVFPSASPDEGQCAPMFNAER